VVLQFLHDQVPSVYQQYLGHPQLYPQQLLPVLVATLDLLAADAEPQQYQQAGQTLVVQQHPSSELDIVRSSQSCSILLMTWATPSYNSP